MQNPLPSHQKHTSLSGMIFIMVTENLVLQVHSGSKLFLVIEVLKIFLTNEMIHNVVAHKNYDAYLAKNIPRIHEYMSTSRRSLFSLWIDVTRDKVWCYMDMMLLMGLKQKPNYHLLDESPLFLNPNA